MPDLDNKTEDLKKYILCFAKYLISKIDDIMSVIDALRQTDKFTEEELKDMPTAKEWLYLYLNHRDVNDYAVFMMSQYIQLSELRNIFLPIYSLSQRAITNQNSISNNSFDYIETIYKEKVSKLKTKYSIYHPEYISFPMYFFFSKVVIPCMFVLDEYPTFLLRRARLGDCDALCNLLRIDKGILCDPRIGKQIYKSSLLEDKSKFEKIINALQGSLSGKYNLLKAKYRMAGFISIVSEKSGHKLSAPEIREIFDEIAAERGNGDLIDTDLPDSLEAFSKAIQRERSYWIKNL